MPTKEELEVENAELRGQLADAQAAAAEAEQRAAVLPNTKPTPSEPSYKVSEGTRAELEENGYAVSPFTGARLVGNGRTFREVDQETFDKVVKQKAAERAAAERAEQK